MGGSDVRHSVLKSSKIAKDAYRQDTHGFREDVRLGSFRRMFDLLLTLHVRYPQLVGARVCLGIAEAGLFPGVVY
jgi:hypothetical protein